MDARRRRLLVAIALALLALLLALRFALQPERATRFLLARVGNTLGLQITFSGAAEYRLRGTPRLVIRGVVAREPGAQVPLLTADRILLSLPWSTIRARGAALDAERLELDRPVLQLAALAHWLSTRPPSEEVWLPTLAQGLQVRDGSLRNDGADADWFIDGVAIDIARLAPAEPLRARVRGRYVADALRVPFDLALALQRFEALAEGSPTGMGIVGRLAALGGDWRLPAHLRLSGPLRFRTDDIRVDPARVGLAGSYVSDANHLPFALGSHGLLRFDDGTLALAAQPLVVRGLGPEADDPIPDAMARGSIALGDALALDLEGDIAQWPAAWPELPAPLHRPRGPVAVALDYRGPTDVSGIVRLEARKDATAFDGRFRIAAITEWLDAGLRTPLPPLDGRVDTPLLEIAGARLEGVHIEVDDPALAPAGNE